MHLMKNRTVLMIFLLSLILVSLLVLRIIPKQQLKETTTPSASESNFLNPPAELAYELDPSIQENLNSLPETSPLILNFNQPIIYPSLKYSISPNIKTIAESGISNTQLIIKPEGNWQTNTKYSLLISSLKAQGGANLSSEIKIEFQAIPKNSNIDYPVY